MTPTPKLPLLRVLRVLLVLSLLSAGVQCASQVSWLPCMFIDEHVSVNAEGHIETELLHRDSMVQFGQKGDPPVNPQTITFLLTRAKLDLRQFLDGVDADQLECEIRRYSTEGIQVRWPVQEPQEYNRWYRVNLKHTDGLFAVVGFLRQPSDQPPSAQDFRKWPPIGDRETLTTAVTMVMRTQTRSVRARLGSQQKLHCQFAVDHKSPDVTVEWKWQHRGERRALFTHASRSGQTRGSGVSVRGLAGGEASYDHPFIRLNDQGTFVCSASVAPLLASLDISLHVEEPPRVSLNVGSTLLLQEGEELKFVCEAQNYYPLDVEIEWYEQDPALSDKRVGAPLPTKVQNTLHSSHKHNADNTLSVSAFFYLQASPKHSGKQFTCVVSHVSLRVPVKKSVSLIVEERSSWQFGLGVGVLMVALLVALFLMLRYLHSAWKLSTQKKPY